MSHSDIQMSIHSRIKLLLSENYQADTDLLAGRLLVLPEEVVEDGAVLLVDALHLVYVLGNLQKERKG